MPVEPVDASTVILVRHGQPLGEPWQLFMLRRHVRSDFAADVYVFPGGKVENQDRDSELRSWIAGDPGLEGVPPDGEEWLPLRLAAIRELFEEAGVLLAADENGGLVRFCGGEAKRFADYREGLHNGGISLLGLVRGEHLVYAVDRLHPFSRWITPSIFPRRFDTRFYVAYLPEDQNPLHDRVETTASTWISPKAALEEYREGRFPLVFATEKHLERMSRYPSIESMIAAISRADMEPVMPQPIDVNGEQRFLIPGDAGYVRQG